MTVIDALRGDRAFDVFPNSSLALEGVTVRRGRSGAGGPGGAVRNQGTLVVLRSAFEDNTAGAGVFDGQIERGGSGGAIWSGGPANPSVLIAETLYRGNVGGAGSDGSEVGNSLFGGGLGGPGGAIAVESGTLEVSASTFAENRAGDGGAGITGSTGGAVASGFGGDGGGIAVTGSATASVVNSTFTGNVAGGQGPLSPFPGNMQGGEGGAAALAVGASGTLRISWSTFAANARGARGTGVNSVKGGQVSASVIADAAPACNNTPGALLNLILPGDTSCPAPRIVGDPKLGPLAANGGPTPTMLPGAGSAAINALVGVPCPGTDQRGLPRPQLGGCDAGAVEVQPSRARRGRRRRARRRRGGRGPARLGPEPEPGRLPGRRLGRQRRGSEGQVTSGEGADRHHRPLPPGRRRAGHLHGHQAGPRPAQGQALRGPGRGQAGRQALRPHQEAPRQLRPPGRRRPEQLPLHRAPPRAQAGPRPLQPGGPPPPAGHRPGRAGHQGLPHRPLTRRPAAGRPVDGRRGDLGTVGTFLAGPSSR